MWLVRPAEPDDLDQILAIGLEEGVMVLVAGANVIRLAPSLIIPEPDIELALERFEAAVKKLTA